jgi:hypothetical protein
MKTKVCQLEEATEYLPNLTQNLHDLFSPVVSEKFDSIYVCQPHQCFSDYYKPETQSEKQAEIYVFSVPLSIIPGSKEELTNDYVKHEGCLPLPKINGRNLEYGFQYKTSKALQFRYGLVLTKALPAEFTPIVDDDNNILAFYKENQLWVLPDLFHNIECWEAANQILMYICTHFLH